jgi:pyrimidine operon attenuation protein/uracil phosphoribosyltransferase
MSATKTLVLNHTEVALKIQRIAWQLLEKHVDEDVVYLVGISKSGYWLAKHVQAILKNISDLKLNLIEMEINKQHPLEHEIRMDVSLEEIENQAVVLIDDVLNSGKVLIYGARHILSKRVKQLTTAVLVDRNHKRYPVKADVKGLSLSTSLNEHVEVSIRGNKAEVYLY